MAFDPAVAAMFLAGLAGLPKPGGLGDPDAPRISQSSLGMAKFLHKPTPIEGLLFMDVAEVNQDLVFNPRKLKNPMVQARYRFWLDKTAADLKKACTTHKQKTTGAKKVLSLRLALAERPDSILDIPEKFFEKPGKKKGAGVAQGQKRKAGAKAKAAPAKKPKSAACASEVKKEISSASSSRAELAGVPKETLAKIDFDHVKKVLNKFVTDLARMVDRNWHDCYEESDEMEWEWLEKCGDFVKVALSLAVGKGLAFDKCHDVLKIIADTWNNIQAIPFRGGANSPFENGDPMNDEDLEFALAGDDVEPACFLPLNPEALLEFAWPLLLARAASKESVTDGALFRMIKDAIDHGVAVPHKASEHERSLEAGAVCPAVAHGRVRLSKLVETEKAKWSALPSTRKVHRMRGCRDRRFDDSDDFGDSDDGFGFGF